MTKKKYSRPKHQKDATFADTSEEELNSGNVAEEPSSVNIHGKFCPHIARGLNFGRVKKTLKSSPLVACTGCSKEKTDETEIAEVWLCLQCGYRGCGRTSKNKHGLQHFKTLHSDCHSLVLSTSSGSVWCYDCDDEINLQSSRILKQSVEFVMKMAPSEAKKSFEDINQFSAQQNLQTSVIAEETNIHELDENKPPEKVKSVKAKTETTQKIPIKGLRNLGNTCFFNAVMQNLNQTSLLHHELKNTCTPSYLWEVPALIYVNDDDEITEDYNANTLKLSLPRQLPMENSLLNFLEQMHAVSTSKMDVINPSPLFGEISKKCPQFRHFQQQDSHELLRQLLDGIRQEEIKRQKKAILRHFGLENICPENVDDETKKLIKAYGCYASHTIVEKVFGGLLISTVLCEECKASSQVFEPFMDLSLPLFEEKQQENNEQLYGMLDGGKQDHVKQLRNKKAECESDDNTQGEYVLSKPKNEPGKLSKHQEKKQKQLAKREKQKAKIAARNRKSSLNENCDNSSVSQLKEGADDVNEENEEENNKESENHSDDQENEKSNKASENLSEDHEKEEKNKSENLSDDHENEEVWEVRELFASDEENSKEDNESLNQSLSFCTQIITEPSELNAEPILDTNVLLDSHASEFASTVNEENPSEIENVDEFEENGNKMPSQSGKHEDNLHLMKNLLESETVDKPAIGLSEKLESDHTDELKENLMEVPEDPSKSLPNQIVIEEIVENQENEIENVDDLCSNDNRLKDLTEDFNNSFKISDSRLTNIDDRIQALSMQVKDVRIRKDSDRQENLLNSSESADDYESQQTNYTSPKSSIEDSCSVDNGENWSHSVSEQQTKDWILKTLTTLKPRHHVLSHECSIYSCLSHFTKPELLTGNNKFRCQNCTDLRVKKTGNKKEVVYSNASKQMLIFSPPAVLTLHLKRFQQVSMSLRKVNRFVEFPLVLDLASFCCSASLILPHMSSVEDEVLYSLYGIVEHSGRLTSGHYTAYVKANKMTVDRTFECLLPLSQCDLQQLLQKFSGVKRDLLQNVSTQTKEDHQWYYISDSHVKEVSEAQVLKCQAYILFYERIK